MTKEQQNLAWACLPKETRAQMRVDFPSNGDDWDNGYKAALKQFFGYHNLTSDTEPEEMLCVKRIDVVDAYAECACAKASYLLYSPEETKYHAQMMLLKSLFGDKCLPDKEELEQGPKFNKGDLVKFKGSNAIIPLVIDGVFPNKLNVDFNYTLEGAIGMYRDEDLEPYTKPETRNLSKSTSNYDKSKDNQLKDNMEEKELNRNTLYYTLCKLEAAFIKIRKTLLR